jgi:hypothetical protein
MQQLGLKLRWAEPSMSEIVPLKCSEWYGFLKFELNALDLVEWQLLKHVNSKMYYVQAVMKLYPLCLEIYHSLFLP